MFEPQYQTDPRVPGIGLAFWRSYLGAHLAVEHEGVLPGFNSQIWVAPGDGVGVMAFTNGASGALIWLTAEFAGLLRQLLGVPDEVIRADVPAHPETWADLCGWYPVSARLTDTQARGIAGLGAEVLVRRGQLTLRAVSPVPAAYRGFPLHPDDDEDPYVFRVDLSRFGLGAPRIVFSREPGAGTTRIHTDIGPLSLRKQPAGQNPWPWITGALGAVAAATAVGVVRRRRGSVPLRPATGGRMDSKSRKAK